ncbi:MAG: hypothetical protein M1828_000870 [Chrysothrix sp. TS-e1954]|nr:MAG: hypothetical protein M1828_000870 [Chrysothrix sp. TS-e1954]
MGGLIFSRGDNALNCPRMPPSIYLKRRDEIKEALARFYHTVATPIEGPEKQDYGDIDYYVMQKDGLSLTDTPNLAQALNAKRAVETGPNAASYALARSDEDPNVYVQVDVTICESVRDLEWQLFIHSYGDMIQILGQSLRALGLIFMPSGFHLVIEEIEQASRTGQNISRESSRLLLSQDPDAVMSFLGLDCDTYWSGLKTENQVFEWLCQGSYFDRRRFDENDATNRQMSSRARAGEKQRKEKRGMYIRFISKWLPLHEDIGLSPMEIDRNKVAQVAVSVFDAKTEYDGRILALKRRTEADNFWRLVRDDLPLNKGEKISRALRALKRWVSFDNGMPSITNDPGNISEGESKWTACGLNRAEAREWIRSHWEEAVLLEKGFALAKREKSTKQMDMGEVEDQEQ